MRKILFGIFSVVKFSSLVPIFFVGAAGILFSTQSDLRLRKWSNDQTPTKKCNVLEHFVAIFANVELSIDYCKLGDVLSRIDEQLIEPLAI